MSVVDDAILKLQIFWATFQYTLVMQIAQSLWGIERGLFLMGYVIMLVNRWLMSSAFTPLIQLSSDTLKVATSWAFVNSPSISANFRCVSWKDDIGLPNCTRSPAYWRASS